MLLIDIPVVFICPDHTEKYIARNAHMKSLLTRIGFKTIIHHKSGNEQYPLCLAKATLDILSEYLDDSPVLVIEDDVDLYEDIDSSFELSYPDDTDAFYLGFSKWGSHPTENRHDELAKFQVINEKYIRILNMLSTHAIVYISKVFKEHVIAEMKNIVDNSYTTHTDVAISRLHSSHTIYGYKYGLFFQSKIFGNPIETEISTKYDFRKTDVTVVTAFYPLTKSKHSVEKYLHWARNFFKACSSAVVCYTTHECILHFNHLIRDFSHRILFIGSSLNNWTIAKDGVWSTQIQLDPEHAIHSEELYKVWAIKQEAVCHTIKYNPFQSDTFVWCDIGCFRDLSIFPSNPSFATIPPELKLSQPWFACLKIPDILREYTKSHLLNNKVIQKNTPIITIGGGVLAGNREGWLSFSQAYMNELHIMLRENKFIGKDQLVYRRIILENKLPGTKLFAINARNDYFNRPSDPWFYLTYIFSGIKTNNQ
jgi:hypothetical protein